MVSDEELMQIARKQAKDKAGFYIHFACYLIVNIGLIIFWVVTNPQVSIIMIMTGPLFGWGIGIVAHFVSVFAGANEQRVQKEYKKLKNQ
jgi:hypothetical protein